MADQNLSEVLESLNALKVRCKDGSITRADFDNILKSYYKYFGAYGSDTEVFQLRYGILDVIDAASQYGVIEPSIGKYHERCVEAEFQAGARRSSRKDNVMELYKAYYEAQSLPPEKRMNHITTYLSDARTVSNSINFLFDFFQFISSDIFVGRLAENLAVYYAHYATTNTQTSFEDARDTIRALVALGRLDETQEIQFSAAIASKQEGVLNAIYNAIGIDPSQATQHTRRFTS